MVSELMIMIVRKTTNIFKIECSGVAMLCIHNVVMSDVYFSDWVWGR